MNLPRRFFNFLLDLLFPWQCLYCHRETANNYPLCSDCFNQISIFDDFICPICQKLMTPNATHQSCRQKTKLDALGCINSYHHDILRETIHYFKYNKIISLSQPLSMLMIKFLEESLFFSQLPKDNILLIPLALHLKKKKQRGFNQSELLAKEIANHFKLEYNSHLLTRIKNNPPQVNIKNSEQRKLNVSGIFRIKDRQNLSRKIIILIDDVYTTGATMNEAAKILKKAGAKKVIGLVLAKG